MAWQSRVNWSAQDNRPTWQDLNSWGLDIRTWGGDVDGGGYSIQNLGNLSLANVLQIVQGGAPRSKLFHSAGVTWLTSEGGTFLRRA